MALAAQAEILDGIDEAASEQRLIRAVAGMRRHQMGDMFEQWILHGCDRYWRKGSPTSRSPPEPMRPIKYTETGEKGSSLPFTRSRRSQILKLEPVSCDR